MKINNRWRNGWILVGWFSLAALLILIPFQFQEGFTEEGLRAGIRLSARISLCFFISAFLARPLFLYRKNPLTRWILRNRRYLGVSFASVHTMHLSLIVSAAATSPTFLDSLSPIGLYGGGLGYVFLYAMTATSFDKMVAWMGPSRWKILHTTGLYYLWLVFAFTYVGRSFESLPYLPVTLVVLGAMGFRVGILHQKRKAGVS